MKRMGVPIFISLFYLAGLLLAFSTYIKKEITEFEQIKLSHAIDYASDAAVMELLNSKDLSMDYTDKEFLSVNPQLPLDTFVDMMLFNYGASIDEENRAHIRMNFIPVFVVAAFDGYYVATPQLVKNATLYPENATPQFDYGIEDGEWDLFFSPKLPYKYEEGGSSYALNMGGDYTLKVTGNVLTKDYNEIPGLAKDNIRRQITKIISKNISYNIDRINADNYDWHHTFYIPQDETTFSGVSPIDGPSVIAIVQDLDLTTTTPIGAFSVAGAGIQKTRMVVGYTKSGTKYYCYADKIPNYITVERLFPNVKEAALDGYVHDTEYME